MSLLTQRLKRLIAQEGSVSLADYMTLAAQEYYARRSFLEDFITAPEISQVFGELLGLWCVAVWESEGTPQDVIFAELGGGRGTLLDDALRACGTARPSFCEAIQVCCVETSPLMREAQKATLAHHRLPISWYDHLSALPEGPLLLVANEFFDALPLRQFQRTPTGWRERRLSQDPQGHLVLGLCAGVPEFVLPVETRDAPVGSVVAVHTAAQNLIGEIVHRVVRFGGGALIIDYAETRPSLQGIREHRRVPPFVCEPGEVDISAPVDFGVLARAATQAGAAVYGPVGQGVFLRRLGLEARTAQLLRGASVQDAARLQAAHHRLTAPDQMGTLFQVLALTPPKTPPPPGFGY